jgi:RNA polymerase sigma-70 factor (ECF subfamily)
MTSLEADGSVSEPPRPDPEESGLVRRAMAGQSEAFDALVHLHGSRVFRFLHQLTRHRQDAEDLTQQTFLKAFRHLASFDPERPMINWLLTIARRTALNHFRAARPTTVLPEVLAGSEPSPDRTTEQRDRLANLWDRARAVLSPREFEVLWLRFGEGLSTEEAAQVAGLTRTHLKVLVFRARRTLLKGESLS